MRVVVDHGAAEARRLADADVARDHRVEDEIREVLANLALDVARQARAPVVHRQQHAGDRQPRVELALHQRERVEQAGEALEREVLGLDRHDHPVGRDQGVDRQRAERRRAVEDHVRRLVAQRCERLAQARLGPGLARQLHVRRGEVRAGRQQAQVRDVGRDERLARADAPAEHVVDARRSDIFENPSPTVALACASTSTRIVAIARLGDAGRDVDRRRRLADPALLVRDGVDRSHRRWNLATGPVRAASCRIRTVRTRITSPSSRDSEWPFAGHSLASREAGRRGSKLRADVEVSLVRLARRGRQEHDEPPRADIARVVGGRPRASASSVGVATALPCDELTPSRKRGAAYSSKTGSDASARAVTTS